MTTKPDDAKPDALEALREARDVAATYAGMTFLGVMLDAAIAAWEKERAEALTQRAETRVYVGRYREMYAAVEMWVAKVREDIRIAQEAGARGRCGAAGKAMSPMNLERALEVAIEALEGPGPDSMQAASVLREFMEWIEKSPGGGLMWTDWGAYRAAEGGK